MQQRHSQQEPPLSVRALEDLVRRSSETQEPVITRYGRIGKRTPMLADTGTLRDVQSPITPVQDLLLCIILE